MIYIETTGGLANRMRALASGISISKELDTELVCIWVENSELNASFEQIFEKIKGVDFRTKSKKLSYLKFSNQANLYKRILAKIINKLIGINFYLKEKDILKLSSEDRREFIINAVKKHKRVYLKTCEQYGSIDNELKYFKPIKEINELINTVSWKFSLNTIGVHIRRSDHTVSIQNSPTSLFIEKIAQNIRLNSDVNFFLSTDDPGVEQELKALFGDKIICFEKVLSRDSLIGIQHALVDMYCLSKCSMIYGSYWSSFSALAAQLTQIKLEILINNSTKT
jgi:hypothetical protein